MTGTAIRSPIHAAEERIGGTFEDWDGWLWTTGFGDRDGEYPAIREDVGAWTYPPSSTPRTRPLAPSWSP
jgi:glycine cleavage system aminomethyltransferase T